MNPALPIAFALLLSACSQTLVCWSEHGRVLNVDGVSSLRVSDVYLTRVESHETYCVISAYRSWRFLDAGRGDP